jgi:hypothetical protein
MRRNGFGVSGRPILKPLDNIECRDALLNVNGSEAEWPEANVIIGNPPFLGDKSMLSTLGGDYVRTLRAQFSGILPGGVDLVTYWFEKSRSCIAAGRLQSAGLVSTQTIRRGSNRVVLGNIILEGKIFDNEDAAVVLRRRTLTNLYNERPTWLANAQADLDAAVAHAYGWPADISEDNALAKLFQLNQARAASQIAQRELVANANAN